MLNHQGVIEVIEIKRPQYSMTDEEFERAFGYLDAIKQFIGESPEVGKSFASAKLTIICDDLGLTPANTSLIENNPEIDHRIWHDVLQSTTTSHKDFIAVVRSLQGELPSLSASEIEHSTEMTLLSNSR